MVAIELALASQLMQDTGWIDQSVLLANGWAGKVRLRRVGQVVFFRIMYGSVSDLLNGGAASSNRFFPIPEGFRPDAQNNTNVAVLYGNATLPISTLVMLVFEGATRWLSSSGRGAYQGTISWVTSDSMPTI